jgi:hypothetical protein
MGGHWEYKTSLETRDPDEAKRRFSSANAAFEEMLEAARRLKRANEVQNAVEIADAYLVEERRTVCAWSSNAIRRRLRTNFQFSVPADTAGCPVHRSRWRDMRPIETGQFAP